MTTSSIHSSSRHASLIHDEAELKEILSDGVVYINDLKAILVSERDALERRDTAQLEDAAGSKLTVAKNLSMFDFFRTEIEELAANDSGSVSDAWNQFRSIAKECDELNRTNGAIIRARHEQVVTGLSLLQGRDRDAETYSSKGSASAASGRRKITQA